MLSLFRSKANANLPEIANNELVRSAYTGDVQTVKVCLQHGLNVESRASFSALPSLVIKEDFSFSPDYQYDCDSMSYQLKIPSYPEKKLLPGLRVLFEIDDFFKVRHEYYSRVEIEFLPVYFCYALLHDFTPLMAAVCGENIEMVEFLLSVGSNPLAHVNMYAGNREYYLEKEYAGDSRDQGSHYKGYSKEWVQERGFDISHLVLLYEGISPLVLAALVANKDIFKIILRHVLSQGYELSKVSSILFKSGLVSNDRGVNLTLVDLLLKSKSNDMLISMIKVIHEKYGESSRELIAKLCHITDGQGNKWMSDTIISLLDEMQSSWQFRESKKLSCSIM